MPDSDWITDIGTPVIVIETGLYIDGDYYPDPTEGPTHD